MRNLYVKFGNTTALVLIAAVCLAVVSCTGEFTSDSTATPDNALYIDDFSLGSARNWQLEQDELGKTEIENGKLNIAVNQSNTMQYATLLERTFDNFILEVEVSAIAGEGGNSFGVLFRMRDPSQFYRFDITSDGRFMLERANPDDTWTRYLNDWTSSDAIEIGASNLLRIEAYGPELSFFINGILVHQVEDAQYSNGQIALDAGTFENSTVTAAFDNLKIQSP